MSVDPAPIKIIGNARKGFVTWAGLVQFPTGPFSAYSDSNFEQLGGSKNMYMGLSESIGLAGISVSFQEEQQALVYNDNGYAAAPGIPSPGPYETTHPWTDVVTNSIERNLKFKFTVGQDANGNQPHDGAGVKVRNKLFVQTFTGVYDDLGYGPTFWTWTAGTPTITTVDQTLSATSVTWSSHPNYTATKYCTTEYGPTVIWEGEYNYELRQGWADPTGPDQYYGTTASVTVKYLMDKDGTEPDWDTPDEASTDILSNQKQFKGIEITPPQKGYV